MVRIGIALCLVLLGPGRSDAQSALTLLHPEALAGRWEEADDRGGEVGMNILISTTVPGSVTNLAGIPQTLEHFEIGLYLRSGSDVRALDFSFFTASSTTSGNGGATFDGRRLLIDSVRKADLPEVHVDLAWNEAIGTWTGTIERASFRSRAVTLKRPISPYNSPFVGTWFEPNGLMNNCLHLAEAHDGTLTGWGDDLQIPGRIRYANGLRPPERALEHYGEVARVKVAAQDRIEVELRAYTPMCCSHAFTAAISRDGGFLAGEWTAGPNQAQRPTRWIRTRGESCIAAAGNR